MSSWIIVLIGILLVGAILFWKRWCVGVAHDHDVAPVQRDIIDSLAEQKVRLGDLERRLFFDEASPFYLPTIERCLMESGFSTNSPDLYEFCNLWTLIRGNRKWVEVCMDESTTVDGLFVSVRDQIDIPDGDGTELQRMFEVLDSGQVVLGIRVLSTPEVLRDFYYAVRSAQQHRELTCILLGEPCNLNNGAGEMAICLFHFAQPKGA